MDIDEFKLDRHLARVQAFYAEKFSKEVSAEKKVFYHWSELSGWRFYLKAIRLRDWRSLYWHIRGPLR